MFDWLRSLKIGNNINGAMSVWEDERDFLIWDISQLPTLEKQDTVVFEYNQGKSLDCTIYSAIWAISDLKNYKFSKEEIAEIVASSFEMWRSKWRWRHTNKAVQCASKRWNKKFPNNAVIYYRLMLTDETSNTALDKHYTLCSTYRWNHIYWLDLLKDAIITWRNFWKKTYWHAVNMIRRNWRRYIKDSYKWRKGQGGIACNIYELRTPIEKLLNSTYYPACYLIVNVKKSRVDDLKRLKEFELAVKATLELNENKMDLTNDGAYKKAMEKSIAIDRKKLVDIQIEFDKLW